jgi:hypothetical protein
MITLRLRLILILLCVLLAPWAVADVPRQLMWADLIPKQSASENPFAKLTKEQLSQLGEIATTRERKARGDKELGAVEIANEQALTQKLQQAGIDVDTMLAKRQEMIEKSRARGQAVNAGLAGQVVRMPGYVLPLEFSGKFVSEFLLVPWVGACIHTPPPPPNQIVLVRPEKPVAITGMFEPVWVSGRLTAGALKKSLSMVDGAADIDVGYSVKAAQVEPYKQ